MQTSIKYQVLIVCLELKALNESIIKALIWSYFPESTLAGSLTRRGRKTCTVSQTDAEVEDRFEQWMGRGLASQDVSRFSVESVLCRDSGMTVLPPLSKISLSLAFSSFRCVKKPS